MPLISSLKIYAATLVTCLILAISLPVAAEPDAPPPALAEAEEALRRAQFEDLRPALQPLIDAGNAPARAHLLYALGIFFEHRQNGDDASFPAEGDRHIRQALATDADLDTDPLVFPPTFLARVEQLRKQHRDQSDRQNSDASTDAETAQIFYFERRVETRSQLPLYLPGGVGQFYNGHTFRGITFASLQTIGLAANGIGYWLIESLRSDSGHFASDDIGRARALRATQIAGIALFAAAWIGGVVEAHHSFQPQTVRIRTLDEAPPELEILPEQSHGDTLRIDLRWQWKF